MKWCVQTAIASGRTIGWCLSPFESDPEYLALVGQWQSRAPQESKDVRSTRTEGTIPSRLTVGLLILDQARGGSSPSWGAPPAPSFGVSRLRTAHRKIHRQRWPCTIGDER